MNCKQMMAGGGGAGTDCKHFLSLVPVVTQNKTQLCMGIRELCTHCESNLERAAGTLNSSHWDVDIHADL